MNPFQMAVRVLRGDRRTRVSAILTGVGVAVATALVLLLIGLPFGTQARAERALWQQQVFSEQADGVANLSKAISQDYFEGREITRVDVAQLSQVDKLPPGIDRLPGPGEALVSPELAQLMDSRMASQLSDRFGTGQRGLLGEESLAFPEQLVALVGHAPEEMPQNAMPVQGFPTTGAEPDPLLQLLSGVGVVVLLVPSLVLVASSARLTAARREQRLAALRLAGATPKQVIGMVAAETALASVAGAVLGLAVSPLVNLLATVVPWAGGTWQADDFALPLPLSIGIAVALPALVLLAAVAGMRRVVTAPLGATGGHTKKPLHWWRLLALPAAGLFFFFAISTAKENGGVLIVLGGLFVLVGSAAVIGPWVTSAVGGIFVRVWRKPAGLLAGRRLRDDPKGAYRASAGVVLAVFAGSMALTLLPSLESLAGGGRSFHDSVLYLDSDAAGVQQIADKANGELARYGVPERVTPIPQVSLGTSPDSGRYALVLDCQNARSLLRFDPGTCDGKPAVYSATPMDLTGLQVSDGQSAGKPLPDGTVSRSVAARGDDRFSSVFIDPSAVPEGVQAQYYTLAAPTTPATREVVRTALVNAAAGTQINSRELILGNQQIELADLRRVTVIGLVAAGVLAGCSAAIATAGSVMDRRRTFGALIAAGTPVRTLARALRTEAALPALVATIGAGVVGAIVGLGLFSMVDDGPVVFSPWILAPVALGALVAVLAASVCTPALNRVRAEPLADE
ncbi:FtsX-like permease family protein [Amycolatopsis sp. 195334CR]|uniref:FtsX-like permease family protein n=1 Tax=Amycolatopsis sp. 195334CR TaxID=2814588 RepID=UPI001A8EDFCF|nr:FtsX-like permease family protein [Amycolatopsis sp. 195334CR]MBN6035699.1 ABC transporter permease [Amycolatopsis sp. 195334CR]